LPTSFPLHDAISATASNTPNARAEILSITPPTDPSEQSHPRRVKAPCSHTVARDRLVLEALIERQIPTVIVTSGGYTQRSHQLIAELAVAVVDRLRKSVV